MHDHSFEWIWTKFGMWHPYTLRLIMGRLASAASAHRLALRVIFIIIIIILYYAKMQQT